MQNTALLVTTFTLLSLLCGGGQEQNQKQETLAFTLTVTKLTMRMNETRGPRRVSNGWHYVTDQARSLGTSTLLRANRLFGW